jgi:uncharacterized membrane protein YkvA (DUF1232 family)
LDKTRISQILAPRGAAENERNERAVKAGFWRTVRKAARYVPFMDEVVASYYCALDGRTPLRAKGTLLAALAYFVLPADMMPDFLPVIGFTDDIAVLTAALAAIRPHIKQDHRRKALRVLAD